VAQGSVLAADEKVPSVHTGEMHWATLPEPGGELGAKLGQRKQAELLPLLPVAG
jgi:hypothetical protein